MRCPRRVSPWRTSVRRSAQGQHLPPRQAPAEQARRGVAAQLDLCKQPSEPHDFGQFPLRIGEHRFEADGFCLRKCRAATAKCGPHEDHTRGRAEPALCARRCKAIARALGLCLPCFLCSGPWCSNNSLLVIGVSIAADFLDQSPSQVTCQKRRCAALAGTRFAQMDAVDICRLQFYVSRGDDRRDGAALSHHRRTPNLSPASRLRA